ncbi:hypothetical protein E2C01_089507 [Portunus trituberculatus]|uniref:Uncharacterized protein n=1 Tax=Portunus trituberculatus TaxID=210409 RepID=A0A5B7JIZ5_PORTR|nr:hypothetical protein [Portunus trituberculatus]
MTRCSGLAFRGVRVGLSLTAQGSTSTQHTAHTAAVPPRTALPALPPRMAVQMTVGAVAYHTARFSAASYRTLKDALVLCVCVSRDTQPLQHHIPHHHDTTAAPHQQAHSSTTSSTPTGYCEGLTAQSNIGARLEAGPNKEERDGCWAGLVSQSRPYCDLTVTSSQATTRHHHHRYDHSHR